MTWSVNQLAAQYIARRGTLSEHVGVLDEDATCPHCVEALEMLEIFGLLGQDVEGRIIKAVDNSVIELPAVNESANVVRSQVNVREPNMDRSFVPAGLRDLLPHAEQPKKPKVVNDRKKCGTLSGAGVHLRSEEEICRECKDARNAYGRKRRAEVNQATKKGIPLPPTRTGRPSHGVQPPTPEKCGSLAGRSAHYRRGEEVCRECKDAYNTRMRGRRHRKPKAAGRPEERSA